MGSILRAREAPEVGGDTLFANMEAGYDGLDDETKEQIDGLQAVHNNNAFINAIKMQGASDEAIEAKRAEFPPATHPVSGKKSIYVNRIFTSHIVDMDPQESKRLLQKLYLQAWIADYQCRFNWRRESNGCSGDEVDSVAGREGSALSYALAIREDVRQSLRDERLANLVERSGCSATGTP